MFGRKKPEPEPRATTTVTPPLPPQHEVPTEVVQAIRAAHPCKQLGGHMDLHPIKSPFALPYPEISWTLYCRCGAHVTHTAPLADYADWGVWR
jgi:hypothetical protein